MGFGKPGDFDHGGCVIGAFLYDSYDIRAPRVLKRRDGKFWTLYGCYPRAGWIRNCVPAMRAWPPATTV